MKTTLTALLIVLTTGCASAPMMTPEKQAAYENEECEYCCIREGQYVEDCRTSGGKGYLGGLASDDAVQRSYQNNERLMSQYERAQQEEEIRQLGYSISSAAAGVLMSNPSTRYLGASLHPDPRVRQMYIDRALMPPVETTCQLWGNQLRCTTQ